MENMRGVMLECQNAPNNEKYSVNIFKDGWMGQNLNYEKIFKKLRFLLKFK